jgi:protocatechuate 3,4-dioxygenase beta subunit
MMATTDVNGSYSINITAGTYTVTANATGYQTNTTTNVVVTSGNATTQNFALTQVVAPQIFNISGFKINDTNGNGVWDAGEKGIENWNIKLFNNSGTQAASTSTNASGFYQFTNLIPDRYNVTEETKTGFTPTNSTVKAIIVENMDVINVNFTNQVTVTPPQTFNISGFKINGTDNNGMGIENWNIMLLDDTGAQIASTMTDDTGFYNFTGLTNGTYNVTEGMMTGWTNASTSPMSQMVIINGQDMPDVNFTNMLLPPTPVGINISGFKINDTNGNGVWDAGEMGIPNWKIMLLNDTGVQLANTSTDASGFYQFMNIFPGDYNVVEELKAGFTPTNAVSVPVTVENMDVMGVNFTNQITVPQPQPGTFNISGFKVNDTNGNGVWDNGETGIGNWNIMLLDDKGTQIASTSTDDTGFYEFTNLDPGTYKVTEEMKEGFTPSGDASKDVTIEDKDVSDVNFLNHVTVTPPAVTNTISGFKINDLNGNGKQDQGEEGLPGWNIRLIGIVPGTAGIDEEATTDDNGFYSFENLPAGMYLVVETLQGGYVPVGSPVLVINLANGMNSMNNNFMNRPVSSLVPSLPGISAKHG